jgi:murein DD-endopeptidase MepM/ murein hydrolase activator NlpD
VIAALRWESRGFPQYTSIGRFAGVARAAALRHRGTAALAAAATIGFAAAGWFGVGYIHYQRLARAQQTTAARVVHANAALQDALAQLRDRLGAARQALHSAQARAASLSSEAQRQRAVTQEVASSKADRIAELTRELHLTEAQRVTLMARLSMAEADADNGHARQRQAEAGLDEWQRKVQQLSAERDRLQTEVGQLRQRLALLQTPHSAARATPARPAPRTAAAAATRTTVVVIPHKGPVAVATPRPAPAVASGRLGQFERVLASAGVDVKRLFADIGVRRGLGGPFVPARVGLHESPFNAEKLAALPGILKSLPISAPMRDYRVTSPFGERSDPFNGRPAFHPGIDLAAPYGTPVYATAAGVVTYTGWSGGYGKIVEIDHGHGIVTRYGHLSRFTVLVGEHVASGAQIGYEGSTGRSTGPHVIYEIDINGEPRDPAKFLGLAKLVRLPPR